MAKIDFTKLIFHRDKPSAPKDYKKLEQYGVIGNLETCALVGDDGSIDWLCFPHLESPSVFGALLDSQKGGNFVIQPVGQFSSTQEYIKNTNVLQTKFKTARGTIVLTDFMPPLKKRSHENKHQVLLRKVECLSGNLDIRFQFRPHFNYARAKTTLRRTSKGVVARGAGKRLFFGAHIPLSITTESGAIGTFTLQAGQAQWFSLKYNDDLLAHRKRYPMLLRQTIKFWQGWSHKCSGECVFKGPWHDLVVRSGLAIKLLQHRTTGAIAAAATTSLPETVGGMRNWDYRYNWIRDSVFSVQALYNLGHFSEARELFNWFKRIYRGVQASSIRIMHDLHGSPVMPERKLNHLAGYRHSKPVRIGNRAARQYQHDIYGELLNVAYETRRYGDEISRNDWKLFTKIINYVCKVWQSPDAGIWEIRGPARHYVYSKVMCWVAIDRGIKIAEKRGYPAPLPKWVAIRDEIKNEVLEKGYSDKLQSFTQTLNSEKLDASSLLIPMVGFLPYEDVRVKNTIKATMKYLMKDDLVYRYLDDGLPGKEGTFILCTFWLVDALALSGELRQAEKLYRNILKYVSPLGLLAEEIAPRTKEQLGNFPQAFSHIGLINSALYIGLSKGRKAKGPKPLMGRLRFKDLLTGFLQQQS
ncbi:MAG: glycoside hydrolase family 15 protein [Candidatus Buchananbacteria bacterium CG10_big_fil_rev_8_21_14_0_10_42_9]|uniref:Glycoside hydrolase family 15 protein n=1 Tax=Candidatus Buchananbacteria bacterium CG10_big_fil_rev_8_21_14_0_10_42_9 TaxID=1974526 RepID=A0A2H0W3I1_9BACT|nr:MAG: glycoside hydrolase family 15 protein [Candidatus Buchananbacteria bacterium CG10_big_fil_rev_8_21_14_0_10_42_9]